MRGILIIIAALHLAAQPAFAETKEEKKSNFKNVLGPSKDDKSPLYVKSDSLTLNAKQRVFTYSGNVEVQKGDLRITCDTMVGTYDDKNELQNILCKENVVITRGTELQANANRANYSVKNALIELTEAPELAREGNVLSADKITIFVDEDRSEAEGNVRVKVLKEEGLASGSVLQPNKDQKASEPEAPVPGEDTLRGSLIDPLPDPPPGGDS